MTVHHMSVSGRPSAGVHFLLLASVLVSLSVLFANTFQYSVPMGYAGLFTQMAEQIAEADFRLPQESPYYGPGGIPFAYPPLGLYLLAFLIKLTGKYFVFLRVVPPLLSLIGLIVAFYLSLELFESPLAAAFITIILAASPDLYISHVWAAGIVRAPAFLFSLLSIYSFHRGRRNPSGINIMLTGVFFGMTILSHLAYALFCLVWLGWFTLFSTDFAKSIRNSIASFVLGLFVAFPWIWVMISRHGWGIFTAAYTSHGGPGINSLIWQPLDLMRLFSINFAIISSNLPLFGAFLVGTVALMVQRRFSFPLFFLLVTLYFPENARFVYLLGGMFAGYGIWVIFRWLTASAAGRRGSIWRYGGYSLGLAALVLIWWGGFSEISLYKPHLNESLLECAEYIRSSTNADTIYLALIAQDEAEWMPFLFEREPLTAQWGSEWLGKYNEQTLLMSQFQGCRMDKDWECVERLLEKMPKSPQMLLTYAWDRKINVQIEGSKNWEERFVNGRYVVWEK
ncbi:MAG: hypothetical protein FJZ87_15100, partial [Chloroflexi bacterium]|nr:hypothetical protein [Chloroflexota bacterium]